MMTQNILVFLILAASIGYTIYSLLKKVKKPVNSAGTCSSCEGCSCSLKEMRK